MDDFDDDLPLSLAGGSPHERWMRLALDEARAAAAEDEVPVGAIVVAGAVATGAGTLLGFLAVVLAMINVAGGFVVTHRMLEMFQPKKK